MQRDPQQGTGAHDVVLRCVFTKIFQRCQRPGDLLHLIKDQQCIFRVNFPARVQLQPQDQALCIQIRSKQLCHSGIGIKIDIHGIPIGLSAEFLHQPGLAHLAGSLNDQGLTTSALLPGKQVFHSHSVHIAPPVPYFRRYHSTESQKLQRNSVDILHFLQRVFVTLPRCGGPYGEILRLTALLKGEGGIKIS